MSKIPGANLIAEILNGNDRVISKVYKKVYHHLENYGKVVKASEHNVKESVQDAFEIFYRQILDEKLTLSCTVETYIISIAKNILHKNEVELGFFNKTPLSKIELIDEIDVDQKIEEFKHKLFISEFKKLNEECRKIITLTLEGYDASQTKTLMKLSSVGYVRLKRLRCKNYLTERIKENPDYEKLRNANPEDFELPLWRDEPEGEEPV